MVLPVAVGILLRLVAREVEAALPQHKRAAAGVVVEVAEVCADVEGMRAAQISPRWAGSR